MTRPVLYSLITMITLPWFALAARAEDLTWPIVSDGQPMAVVVTPEGCSPAVDTAANEIVSCVEQVTGATLPRISYGREVQAGMTAIYVGCPQVGTMCQDAGEAFHIETQQAPASIVLSAVPQGDDDIVVRYAAARFLEELGVRFFHPEATYVPHTKNLDVGQLDIHETAAFRWRGIQQHTLHPIPFTTIIMQEPTEENYQRACRYIDWLVHNRQNYFFWWHRDWADPVKLKGYIRRISDYAHDNGVKLGVVVGMPFVCPQGSYNILQSDVCHEDRETWSAGLRKGTDQMAGLGIDALCVFFGHGEGGSFKQPDDCPPTDGPVKPVLERIEVLRQYMEKTYPELKLVLWMHPTLATRGDESCPSFFLLPKLTHPDIIAGVHTVMFYNLFDPAPTAYGPDFSHMRQFVLEQYDQRPIWYWPETAYACGFDVGVPQYWPEYLSGRWTDAEFLAGKVEGHITFSSGLEWMYWLNDYGVARFGWNPHTYRVPDVIDDLASIFAPEVREVVYSAMVDLTLANDHYLIRLTNQGGLNLMDMLSVGMMLHHLDRMKEFSADRLIHRRDLELPALKALGQCYREAYERLQGVSDRIEDHQRPWYNELCDTLEITALRFEHQWLAFHTLTVGLLEMKADREPADPQAALDRMTEIQKSAAGIIARREQLYRYPNGGYRGKYVGYMRPFAEWERVSNLVGRPFQVDPLYKNMEVAAWAKPNDLKVNKPLGHLTETAIEIPNDFPVDQPLSLLVQVYDTDSPQEGTVLIAGREYSLIESGNSKIVAQKIDLPAGAISPGRVELAFKFNDDVNGTTSGYEARAICIAKMKP